jgi:hypothetical protein
MKSVLARCRPSWGASGATLPVPMRDIAAVGELGLSSSAARRFLLAVQSIIDDGATRALHRAATRSFKEPVAHLLANGEFHARKIIAYGSTAETMSLTANYYSKCSVT